MATNMQTALQAKSLGSGLTVGDLQRSIQFYEGLGFGVGERWEDKGVLQGVMLRAGQVTLNLSQDDWKKGRDRAKGVGMRLFIDTAQDVDQVAARARDAGIKLDSDPHDTEWNTRTFDVTDPDGFKLSISTEARS